MKEVHWVRKSTVYLEAREVIDFIADRLSNKAMRYFSCEKQVQIYFSILKKPVAPYCARYDLIYESLFP